MAAADVRSRRVVRHPLVPQHAYSDHHYRCNDRSRCHRAYGRCFRELFELLCHDLMISFIQICLDLFGFFVVDFVKFQQDQSRHGQDRGQYGKEEAHPEHHAWILCRAFCCVKSDDRQNISLPERECGRLCYFLKPARCRAVHAFAPKSGFPFVPVADIGFHRRNNEPEAHFADADKGLHDELQIGHCWRITEPFQNRTEEKGGD